MKKFILLVALLLWGVGIGFAETSVDAVATEDGQENTEYFSLRGRTVDQDIVVYGAMIESEPDDSWWYAHRAECYIVKKDYVKAIEDICKSLEIDKNVAALSQMFYLPMDQCEILFDKLDKMYINNYADYHFDKGLIYESYGNLDAALISLKAAVDIDPRTDFLCMIAEIYKELGNLDLAFEYINHALTIGPTDDFLFATQGDLYAACGNYEMAVRSWSEYLKYLPQYVSGSCWLGGYYTRGLYEERNGDLENALADYKASLKYNPHLACAHLGIGDVLSKMGQKRKAKKAYKKIIEYDTESDPNACAMYAYLALGEREKAIDCMNRMIEYDPDDEEIFYNAACLYSRMGDLDKSLEYLQIAFENGFRRFHQVYSDNNLERLRGSAGFKTFMSEYE